MILRLLEESNEGEKLKLVLPTMVNPGDYKFFFVFSTLANRLSQQDGKTLIL